MKNNNGSLVDVSSQTGDVFRVPRAARGAAFADLDNDVFLVVGRQLQWSKCIDPPEQWRQWQPLVSGQYRWKSQQPRWNLQQDSCDRRKWRRTVWDCERRGKLPQLKRPARPFRIGHQILTVNEPEPLSRL